MVHSPIPPYCFPVGWEPLVYTKDLIQTDTTCVKQQALPDAWNHVSRQQVC